MMKPSRTTLGSWLALAAGLLAGACLVWFVGPLLDVRGWRPLDSMAARALVITAMLLLPLLASLLRYLRAMRQTQLATQLPDAIDTVVDQALLRLCARPAITADGWRGLRERWQQLNGPDPLLALPWVLVIGMPSAGTRRALVLDGYELPALAERAPEPPCTWCITPTAVLILVDMQATDPATGTWQSLLQRLTQARPLQPVSAVLTVHSRDRLRPGLDGPEDPDLGNLRLWLTELVRITGLVPPLHLAVFDRDLPLAEPLGAQQLQAIADAVAMVPAGQRPATLLNDRNAALRRLIDEQVLVPPQQPLIAQRNLSRQRWLVRGGYAATVVVVLSLAAGWAISRDQNLRRIAQHQARLPTIQAALDAAQPALARGDVIDLLPALNQLEQAVEDAEVTPWRARLGLSQGDKLKAFAYGTYQRLLLEGLAPALSLRLEGRLRDMVAMGERADDDLYDILRVYMGVRARTVRNDVLVSEFTDQLRALFALSNRQNADLWRHVMALVDTGGNTALSGDASLVSQARQLLVSRPLDRLLYRQMIRGQAVPPQLTLKAMVGEVNVALFTRKSGKPLSEGVASRYTLDGIGQFDARMSRDRTLAEIRQVLGQPALPPDQAAAADAPVRAAALQRYLQDYSTAWDGLLEDLRLAPVADSVAGASLADRLTRADSPLRALLRKAAEQTSPGTRLSPLTDGRSSTAVDEHFAALHALFAGQPPPLEEALAQLAAVVKLAATGVPVATLNASGSPLPQPLRNMMAQWGGAQEATGPTFVQLSYAGIIASLAEAQIAGTPTAKRVQMLLGELTLKNAVEWGSCAKNVKLVNGNYQYSDSGKWAACSPVENAREMRGLISFVQRNRKFATYQYTEIPIQRDFYAIKSLGARDDDVVAALNAAISTLQGGQSIMPISLGSKRESLLLLTQLVSDLHRPLHVGAIYLDSQGKPVDPDLGTFTAESNTAGANRLKVGLSEGASTLHALWDRPPSNGVQISTLAADARQVVRSPGGIEQWPTLWATESLLSARAAFKGESCAMGESLTQRRRVWDEGLRIVNHCREGRIN